MERTPINSAYNNIFKSVFLRFKNAFNEDSYETFWDEEQHRYIHPGEFGRYREKITSEFLKILLPSRIGIGTGFVISPYLKKPSSQADIVLYDKINGTMLETDYMQTFFPAESTLGVVEIKSDLNKSDFINAVRKLSEFKKIRESIQGNLHSFANVPMPLTKVNTKLFKSIPNPNIEGSEKFVAKPIEICRTEELPLDMYEGHNIATVLICRRLKYFELSNDVWRACYHDVPLTHRVNIIYSLEDGMYVYGIPVPFEKLTVGYPFAHSTEFGPLPHTFTSTKDELIQAKNFAHQFNQCLTSITTIRTELAAYLQGLLNDLERKRHMS